MSVDRIVILIVGILLSVTGLLDGYGLNGIIGSAMCFYVLGMEFYEKTITF